MPTIIMRKWTARGANGRRVKRIAFGYDLTLPDGQRERRIASEWASESDAHQALGRRLEELARGDQQQQQGVPPSVSVNPAAAAGMTLAEAKERYLRTKEAERKGTRDDRQHLARLVAFFGGATSLAELTAARVSEYRVTRANDKSKRRLGDGQADAVAPTVSAATVNRELATLRHLLRLAVEEWEVLDKVPTVRLLKEPEGRIRWLGQHTPKEEEQLLSACAVSGNPNLSRIVAVALETGMRQGEVMGLAWERVDLSRGVIQLERTKSGRRREIPMRQAVYDALAPLRAKALDALKPGPDGEAPKLRGPVWPDRRFPRAAWEGAVERAGLEDVHFHDCRHHFASWFMMRGGDLLTLSRILGHRDLKMTQRYAHLSPEHLRAEMEKTAAPVKPSPVASPAPMAHSVAQSDRIEADRLASPRHAGVAQRQSN